MIYILICIGLIIALVLEYFVYLFCAFYRIPDNQILEIDRASDRRNVPIGKNLSIMTYNIGFAAYLDDFSFFMDGGKYSRAYSEDSVKKDLKNISRVIEHNPADFMFIQEVDLDATRSYHVNEQKELLESLDSVDCTSAIDYDSPYLFYPISKPHGKSLSSLLTASKYCIRNAVRRSLTIQDGVAKFLDLDRCFSCNWIDTEDGKKLCLIHFHLSAYATDPSISDSQLIELYEVMKQERQKGNYVIAGGDFNKDLLGDSSKFFVSDGRKHAKTTPFPFEILPKDFELLYPYDKKKPIATCRNSHEPYKENSTYVQTIDGFIVSDNIDALNIYVVDTGFKYSDHNPVILDFALKTGV